MIGLSVLSLLCSTNCGSSSDVPQSYDNFCDDEFREYGANQFILAKCDYQFTDIMDVTTEWPAAMAADSVRVSPRGKLVVGEPTVNTFEIEGCGREIVGEVEYLVDFETYQTKDDLSDSTYWSNLFSNSGLYRLFWIDCDGILTLADNWADAVNAVTVPSPTATVSGESPGFIFSITKPPFWVEGEQGYGKWVTQFKVKKVGILKVARIPGLSAILI